MGSDAEGHHDVQRGGELELGQAPILAKIPEVKKNRALLAQVIPSRWPPPVFTSGVACVVSLRD